jgi:hypothetical protein
MSGSLLSQGFPSRVRKISCNLSAGSTLDSQYKQEINIFYIIVTVHFHSIFLKNNQPMHIKCHYLFS